MDRRRRRRRWRPRALGTSRLASRGALGARRRRRRRRRGLATVLLAPRRGW